MHVQMLITYTDYDFVRTERVPPSDSNAAAVGVSVTFTLIFIAALIAAAIVGYIWWR